MEKYDITDYLKDDKELQKAVIDEFLKEIAELKAENDRLKEEIKQLEDFVKSDGEIDHINHEYTYKLKQTLQEIKEIAERNIFLSPKLLEINGDIGQIQNIAITQILDLITKAEEE